MRESFLRFVVSIVTVSLIAAGTRWLSTAKGAQFPKALDGTKVYGIKWQWRIVGLGSAVFWAALCICFWRDPHPGRTGLFLVITLVSIAVGLWLASGSVTINESGITKKSLWTSLFFQWKDITEIQLHKKQGGAIELRAGSKKLIIDSRFDAFQHLLNEIENHTQVQPSSGS